MNVPPKPVQDACALGLAEWDRLKVGGTRKAVGFATACAAQLPFDADTARLVMEAHVALAQYAGPDEPTSVTVSRMLWGGTGGWAWAEQVIAADESPDLEPVLIEAERDTSEPLEGMVDELFTIDQSAIEALEAAFWVAYRQALRATGRTVQAAANRTRSLKWQAEAGFTGNELQEARDVIVAAHPFNKWRAADDRIHAAIDADLDRAVEDALTDFEATAFSILVSAVGQSVEVTASGLGVARSDLVPPDEGSIRDAVALLRAALLEWIRARLSGGRGGSELPELTVPAQIFRESIARVGGVPAVDDGVPVDALGEIAGQSLASGMMRRAAEAITVGSVVSALFSKVEVQRRVFWWYGRRAARETPNEDHYRAARRVYTASELAGLSVWPGQFPDCQCRAIPLPPKVTRK